jgi:hypothetical protein
MPGFLSAGRSYGAGVVARVSRSGWVWSWRAAAPGLAPAPAALFVPFASFGAAVVWSRKVARSTGWRVWVRRGSRCSCWSSGAVSPVPAWAVKVALPAGWSAARARRSLPLVPGPAAGAAAPAAGPGSGSFGQRSALASFI